jgi:arginine decarboxylase
MKIHVLSSAGSGRTDISAFDAALYNAGIANFNLIPLSSVIPPGAEVIQNISIHPHEEQWGNKLYCVLSRNIVRTFGEQAWAGIGWVQAEDGRGLFVEHHAESETSLRKLIDNSFNDMLKYRDVEFGPIQYSLSGIECVDRPVCALSIATYEFQGWKSSHGH